MRWNGRGEVVCPLRGQSLETRLAAQRSVIRALGLSPIEEICIMRRSRGKAIAQLIGIWLLFVLAWAAFYVASVLSGPPSGDLYANEPSFQLVAFAIVRLPWAILGLIIGLVVVNFHYGVGNKTHAG